MTDQDKETRTEPEESLPAAEPFDEFAVLEQNIRRRLRSNQRFLERFMDEDFDDEDEDLPNDEDDIPDEEL